jgi:hypothetical protein
MRRGVVFVVALLATAGGVMAAYFGARHYGENRIRETMNTVVAGTATVANLQYGAIAFDPLARRASVQDVAVSWQNADLTIGRVVFSDVDFGAFDPEHGRVELHAVTDGGFFNSLVGWIAQCGTLQGFVSRDGPWATVKYNLLIEYDYEANSRSLTIRKLEWSAPEWGDLAVTLDVTHLPEPLRLPDLAKTGSLGGPITVLKALLAQLPDLEPTLIRAATLTYRDHGAINRIIDGMAESVADGDPQVYFLDRRDALKRKIADGKAAAWDQPLLDVLLGKADVDLSVAPQSPVPLARVLRLPQDAAATTGALALKMATAGTRDLGHFAITEKEERALRARPFIEAGDFGLTEPDLPNKFVALSSFQKAVTIAPDDPRAVEGVGHAVAVLIGEARKREEAGAFYGEDGAVPLYQKIIQRVPDSAAAKAAFAAVPQHLAAAALAYAEMTDGAESAYALLRGATSMNAADPAVLAAADRVADRLVEQGDRRADEGAYLDESSRLGALTYYGDALALMPGKASALRALDTAASRLRVDVAQRVSVGDQAVAADTVAAIKRQWPELPGKDDLAAQFVALLTPPRSTAVFVYNWSDYIGEFTNQRFTEKTGISVRYDVFDSNETLEAKLMGGNTGYDVVVPSGVFLGRQIPAGVFRKLDKSKLPNLANLDPALMAASSAFDPDHAYAPQK